MSKHVPDRANYLQAHKDDPAEWGEPVVAPRRRKGRLGATVTVRLQPDDADLLREVAARDNLGYSDVIRRAVNHYLRPTIAADLTQPGNLWAFMGPPTAAL